MKRIVEKAMRLLPVLVLLTTTAMTCEDNEINTFTLENRTDEVVFIYYEPCYAYEDNCNAGDNVLPTENIFFSYAYKLEPRESRDLYVYSYITLFIAVGLDVTRNYTWEEIGDGGLYRAAVVSAEIESGYRVVYDGSAIVIE